MINKQQFLNKIKEIEFNDINSDVKIVMPKFGKSKISWLKTNFPTKKDLLPLTNVDGMSTAANCYLINEICKSLNENQLYLNIGVWNGLTYFAGLINTNCKAIGVDNFSQFGGPRNNFLKHYENFKRLGSQFYDKDYINYFKTHTDKIDFYFYDGHHSYDNQYQAIIKVAPFLKKDSLVLVDDTNNEEPRNATFNALKDLNLKYDIWCDIKTAQNGHPTYWNGLLLCQII
jgi:hypothetical protein